MEQNSEKDDTVSETDRKKIFLFLIAALVVVLPVANVAAVRSALFITPALVWIYGMAEARKWKLRRTPMDLPLFLFLLAIIFSIFTSLKHELSINELRKEFLTYTLVYYMVLNMLNEDSNIKTIVKVLLGASFFMALYGVIEFFGNGGSLFTIEYRAGSLHQGFEAYAQYIIMVLPFSAVGFVYLNRQGASMRGLARQRIFVILIIALNLMALYLTHTRGAWIALWVEVFLLTFLVVRDIRLRLVIAALLIIIPIAGLKVLPESVVWHGSKGLDIPERNIIVNTGSARLKVWRGALKGIRENPFDASGYGKTNFMRRFPGQEFLGFDQAHNTFVNTAVQLGVQGLTALLIIIGAVLFTAWKVYRREEDPFRKLFAAAVIVMTAGFFTANMFAEFYIDDTALLFWIIVALVVSVYNRPNIEGSRES